jgi:hypothetical protein
MALKTVVREYVGTVLHRGGADKNLDFPKNGRGSIFICELSSKILGGSVA